MPRVQPRTHRQGDANRPSLHCGKHHIFRLARHLVLQVSKLCQFHHLLGKLQLSSVCDFTYQRVSRDERLDIGNVTSSRFHFVLLRQRRLICLQHNYVDVQKNPTHDPDAERAKYDFLDSIFDRAILHLVQRHCLAIHIRARTWSRFILNQ